MKVSIIGSSGHYGYALPEIIRNPELELVAVAAGSPGEDMTGLSAYLAQENLQITSYSSYLNLLEEEKPDIVIINTHFHNNAAVVKQALKRQIHVFAEKPLALELADLAEIESLWQQNKVQLTTMLGLRYAAHFYTGQQLCRQGAIGQPGLLQGQKSYRLGQRPH